MKYGVYIYISGRDAGHMFRFRPPLVPPTRAIFFSDTSAYRSRVLWLWSCLSSTLGYSSLIYRLCFCHITLLLLSLLRTNLEVQDRLFKVVFLLMELKAKQYRFYTLVLKEFYEKMIITDTKCRIETTRNGCMMPMSR